MDEQPKTKRRGFQISLRTLLLLVTIASFGFGWLGWKVRQAQQQKEAVEAIRELGVLVMYDHEIDPDCGEISPPNLPGPVWLRNLVGVDFLANVVLVRSRDIPITDADLIHLREFKKLQQLTLIGARVTDNGLVDLQTLTRLWALDLSGTKTTDAALVHLRGLTRLRLLYLRGTNVTDEGLVHLRGLTQLVFLDLGKTTLTTNEGCQELHKALPNLRIVNY